MAKPRFTDARRRYRTAEESRAPGYLARRFKAYTRLERMKQRPTAIEAMRKRKAA